MCTCNRIRAHVLFCFSARCGGLRKLTIEPFYACSLPLSLFRGCRNNLSSLFFNTLMNGLSQIVFSGNTTYITFSGLPYHTDKKIDENVIYWLKTIYFQYITQAIWKKTKIRMENILVILQVCTVLQSYNVYQTECSKFQLNSV